jgi:hypothetical protein
MITTDDKEQLTALINATSSKYSKNAIESALNELGLPSEWKTDIQELKGHFKAYQASFGSVLFWEVIRAKGFGEVTATEIKKGEHGIAADWDEVSYVEINGKYENKAITEKSWEMLMLEKGDATIHISGENAQDTTVKIELEEGGWFLALL